MTPTQLETLLRVRRHRRDQVRLALAGVLAEGRKIEEAAAGVQSERDEALAALRSGTTAGGVDIDHAAALRYHAGRMSVELAGLAQAAAGNAERSKKVRELLTEADRGVKVVERLQERMEAERRRDAERRTDRDATDRFAAARHLESSITIDPQSPDSHPIDFEAGK